MARTYNGNLNVLLGISVGNWIWGSVSAEMDPGVPVSIDVSGINIQGEGDICYQVTSRTRFPWFSTSQPTVSSVNDSPAYLPSEDGSQFRIWMRRKNRAVTSANWMVWRDAT